MGPLLGEASGCAGSNVLEKDEVTIVTRTKNRLILLQRCIQSVLNQTYQNWRHVIVNDGGDRIALEMLLSEFKLLYRGRLDVIHHVKSIGMQNASNAAIATSSGEFITIHDDDDWWSPAFLQQCVTFMNETSPKSVCKGVVTQTTRVFEEIGPGGEVLELRREAYLPVEHISLFRLASDNLFPPIAFLYRREVHGRIGVFDQRFSVLGDWDFNLRFLQKYEIGVIMKSLAFYSWRYQGGESAYANTVTGGISEHHVKANEIRNHYLRDDLETGSIGVGYLLNLSMHMHGSAAKLWDLNYKTERVLKTTQQIEKRLAPHSSNKRNGGGTKRSGITMAAVAPNAFVGGVLYKSLVRKLERVSVLSLDVFDTALLRLVRKPADVFLFAQAKARLALGQPEFPFAQARSSAERIARETFRSKFGNDEVTLEQIYRVLCDLGGIDPALVAGLMQAELDAEGDLCYANALILELCRNAKRMGKRVIFLSDTYFSSRQVGNLLQAAGYPPLEIFVSSEYQASKHDGRLFDLVILKMGASPEDILHIGDNHHSDCSRAHAHGWNGVLFRQNPAHAPFIDEAGEVAFFVDNDVSGSLTTGLARRRHYSRFNIGSDRKSDVWQKIGYEIAGPIYLSFLSWIIKRSTELGVKRLFFLSRDGYNLLEAFNLMVKRWQLDLGGTYLYASRRLYNVPSIGKLDGEAIEFLLTPNPGLRVKDFFLRIGLDPRQYREALHDYGFRSLNELLTTDRGAFASDDAHRRLRFCFKLIANDIELLASNERSKALDYLRSHDFGSRGVAIVDLGWRASLLGSLQGLIRMDNDPAFRLRGFYFGTWQQAQAVMDADCELESFFFHLGKPEARRSLVSECVELVELLFSAPHPSIIGLQKCGASECWSPVYGRAELNERHMNGSAMILEGALAYVEDMLRYSSEPMAANDLTGYIERVLKRLLSSPTLNEARELGSLPHRDAFGDTARSRFLAKLPSLPQRWVRPRSLIKAYRRSYWKKAFLAQLSPKRAAWVKSKA